MNLNQILRRLLSKSFKRTAGTPPRKKRTRLTLTELEPRITPSGGSLANQHDGFALVSTTPGTPTIQVLTQGAINIAAVTPTPSAPTNLALSTGGNETNKSKPTITGNAQPGSTVKLYADNGVSVVGTGTANNRNGSFSITLSTALTDGSHSITATATAGGKTSPASLPLTFTVDTQAPAAPTNLALSTGGTVTSSNQPTITGNAEDGSTVTLYQGKQVVGTGSADAQTGAFSITLTQALPDGSHSITAKATDAAGNTSVASAPFNFTVAAPITITSSLNVTAVAGATTRSIVLATFTANPADTKGDLSAIINWGDTNAQGQPNTSIGVLTFKNGTWSVSSYHVYAQPGTYGVSVDITSVGGSSATTRVGFTTTTAVIGATEAPGVWYPDRYPPAGFTAGQTGGGRSGVLDQYISSADADGSRPSQFNTGFYDYQGRKYDLAPGTTFLAVNVYVSSSWASLNQQDPNGNSANYGSLASLWATGVDGSQTVTSFPIIGFNNTGGTGSGGFQVFDQTNGWTNVPGFTGYNKWYQLGMKVDGNNLDYYVNGALVYTDTTSTGTVTLSNVILEGYNGGNSYNIFWDNLRSTNATVTR